jgi:uncharacterized membrane protein
VNATIAWRTLALEPARVLSLVRQPAAWSAGLAFLLYLPAAVSVLQLDPDAIEHIDLARRFIAGQGYVLGIKAYHVGGTEVVHNGLDERAPLYPLLVAAVLKAGLGVLSLQVVNALLAAGCAALICAIGSALFGRQTGALAGSLVAASPPVLIFMVPPMTEALAIFLVLLATWLVIRRFDAPRTSEFALAGVALGLGYLTRPVTAALFCALLLGLVLVSQHTRRLVRPLGALVAAAAAFMAPITLYSILARGSLSYSRQTYLYAVFQPTDVQRDAFSRPIPTPIEFISTHPGFVIRSFLENTAQYAGLLLLDWKWLLLLLPALGFVPIGLARGRYPRAAWVVLLLAAANFFVYAWTWSAWTRRYQLLTLLLLLPFAVDGLTRLGLDRFKLPRVPRITGLHLLVAAVMLVWFQAFLQEYRGTFRYGDDGVGTRAYRGVKWTGATAWVEDRDVSQVLDWVGAHTERDAVLAHALPEIFTFFTERPSTRLPRRLDQQNLKEFLINYRVSYVLLNNYDGYRRRYQNDLLTFETQGVSVTPVGDYRIFDTRPLWSHNR